MKKLLIHLVIMSTILFIGANGCNRSKKQNQKSVTSEQTINIENQEVEAYQDLNSEDWRIRKDGIHILAELQESGHQLGEKTITMMLELLDKETQNLIQLRANLRSEGKSLNEIIDTVDKKYPPDPYGFYTTNLAKLIGASNYLNSPEKLFKFLLHTNTMINPALLATVKVPVFDFIIDKTKSQIADERYLAVQVLVIWNNPHLEEAEYLDTNKVHPLSQEQKIRIKDILLKSIADGDYNIRFISLAGLKTFKSMNEVKEAIQKIAQDDPEQFIRGEAQEILKQQ